jgi:hypothetical protein
VRSTTFLFTTLRTSVQNFGVMRVQTEALGIRSGRQTPRRALAAPVPRPPCRPGCAFPRRCAHQGRPRRPNRHLELPGSSSATHGVAHRSVRAPACRTRRPRSGTSLPPRQSRASIWRPPRPYMDSTLPRRSGPRRIMFLNGTGELLSRSTATEQRVSLALTP